MRFRIALFVLIPFAAACGGSPSTPTPGSTGSSGTSGSSGSTFTATLDGAAFVGKTITATFHAGADFSTLLVNAQDADQNLLSFDIGTAQKVAFAPGTFPLASNGSNAVYNPFPTTGNTGFNATNGPQSGSVIVTAFSAAAKTAAGTFSFVISNGHATKTVTNGMFSVTFP